MEPLASKVSTDLYSVNHYKTTQDYQGNPVTIVDWVEQTTLEDFQGQLTAAQTQLAVFNAKINELDSIITQINAIENPS